MDAGQDGWRCYCSGRERLSGAPGEKPLKQEGNRVFFFLPSAGCIPDCCSRIPG